MCASCRENGHNGIKQKTKKKKKISIWVMDLFGMLAISVRENDLPVWIYLVCLLFILSLSSESSDDSSMYLLLRYVITLFFLPWGHVRTK